MGWLSFLGFLGFSVVVWRPLLCPIMLSKSFEFLCGCLERFVSDLIEVFWLCCGMLDWRWIILQVMDAFEPHFQILDLKKRDIWLFQWCAFRWRYLLGHFVCLFWVCVVFLCWVEFGIGVFFFYGKPFTWVPFSLICRCTHLIDVESVVCR